MSSILALTDWGSMRELAGSATAVPDAVEELASSHSPEEATAAYWRLDNHVVVQGQLFQSALPLVPVLLALLAGDLSAWARTRVLDLLFEIGAGSPDESEVAIGNAALGERCRAAVRDGTWLYYRALLDEASGNLEVQAVALDLLCEVETESDRLLEVLRKVSASHAASGLRERASQHLRRINTSSST